MVFSLEFAMKLFLASHLGSNLPLAIMKINTTATSPKLWKNIHCQVNEDKPQSKYSLSGIKHSSFSQTHNIGNNGNIGIRGFNT